MADNWCFGTLYARRMRVAELLTSGAPDTSGGVGYVSSAIVSLQVQVENETGEEFIQRNGSGTLCINIKEDDLPKRANLTLQLCEIDPQLIALLTGSRVFVNGSSQVIGMQEIAQNTARPKTCLEVWTDAIDGSEQATPPETSPNAAYWHWVFPLCRFSLDSLTLERAAGVPSLTGTSDYNSSITINGPFNDWPSGVSSGGGVTAPYGYFLDDAIPTAACSTSALSGS